MNGPQHFRTAEGLIKRSNEVDAEFALLLIEQAKVHANLAVAAATIDAADTKSMDFEDEYRRTGQLREPSRHSEWLEVIA